MRPLCTIFREQIKIRIILFGGLHIDLPKNRYQFMIKVSIVQLMADVWIDFQGLSSCLVQANIVFFFLNPIQNRATFFRSKS